MYEVRGLRIAGEFLGTFEAAFQEKNGEYTYKRDNNGNFIKDKDGKRIRKNGSRSDVLGNWRVFRNGKEVKRYRGDWTPTNGPDWWTDFWYKTSEGLKKNKDEEN